MAHRPVRWFVLCFAVAWFGILVPVHNRGQIAMPGTAGVARPHCHEGRPAELARPAHACHSTQPDADCHPGSRDDAPDPNPESCAVCFFVAGLHTPPPVTTVEHLLGYAGEAPVAQPAAPESARLVLPFHSRAPPRA